MAIVKTTKLYTFNEGCVNYISTKLLHTAGGGEERGNPRTNK